MRVEMSFEELCDYLLTVKEKQHVSYRWMYEHGGGPDTHVNKLYLTGKVKNRTGGTVEAIAASLGVKAEQKFIVEVEEI